MSILIRVLGNNNNTSSLKLHHACASISEFIAGYMKDVHLQYIHIHELARVQYLHDYLLRAKSTGINLPDKDTKMEPWIHILSFSLTKYTLEDVVQVTRQCELLLYIDF